MAAAAPGGGRAVIVVRGGRSRGAGILCSTADAVHGIDYIAGHAGAAVAAVAGPGRVCAVVVVRHGRSGVARITGSAADAVHGCAGVGHGAGGGRTPACAATGPCRCGSVVHVSAWRARVTAAGNGVVAGAPILHAFDIAQIGHGIDILPGRAGRSDRPGKYRAAMDHDIPAAQRRVGGNVAAGLYDM